MRCTMPEIDGQVTPKKRKPPMQRLLEIFSVALLSGIVFLLSAQVVVRHLGGSSLPWSGEMATWLFSWASFIGAVLVYMEKKHIVIDFLIPYLSPKIIKILDVSQQFLITLVLVTLLVTGIQITSLYSNQTATSIEISQAFVFVSLPVASALMLGWTLYGWIKGRLKK
jgi:TRAP-type C4-dicarboxylate transport system permease small subunit